MVTERQRLDDLGQTDYQLQPLNAEVDGAPYEELRLTPGGSIYFDLGYGQVPKVRVTGRFGWPEVPVAIVQATSMLAARYLKRTREAPYGVAGLGGDGVVVRVSQTDPDVDALLATYVRQVRLA